VSSVQSSGFTTAVSGWHKRRVASGTVRSASLQWDDEAASDAALVRVVAEDSGPASSGVATISCENYVKIIRRGTWNDAK